MTAGDRLRWLFVTGCGIGCVPRAPGTAASALAVAAVWVCDTFAAWPWWGPAVPAAAAAIGTISLGGWAARHFHGKDPGAVVCDELCGQWLALAVPLRDDQPALAYGLAFVLFRLFDVMKPFGIRRVERLAGGWGILMDDVLAGVLACAILAAAWGMAA